MEFGGNGWWMLWPKCEGYGEVWGMWWLSVGVRWKGGVNAVAKCGEYDHGGIIIWSGKGG